MKMFGRGREVAARDKHYLSLYREYQKLLKVECSAPLIELDNPYQRGWIRFFRLRSDALSRKDAPALKDILERINVYQYCRNGTFMQRHGKSKKLVPIGHRLKYFNVNDSCWLSWPAEYRKYFELKLVAEMNWKNECVRNHRCVFSYPHYCVSYVEKHYVTHRRACLPEVQARLAQIDNYFEQNLVRERIGSLRGHLYRWESKPMESKNAEFYAIRDGLEEGGLYE